MATSWSLYNCAMQFLVACTRLYWSPCRSVHPSVGPSPLASLSERPTDVPTHGQTDSCVHVTYGDWSCSFFEHFPLPRLFVRRLRDLFTRLVCATCLRVSWMNFLTELILVSRWFYVIYFYQTELAGPFLPHEIIYPDDDCVVSFSRLFKRNKWSFHIRIVCCLLSMLRDGEIRIALKCSFALRWSSRILCTVRFL